ncbi:hypothetical protein Syun_012313 [Stephania yunnanensis]|uniref:Uncharacterized protein n=1 Tax=Stephania yunnanensis TaxID=152371 RepID=A0AAP0PF72_9MAGN
MRDTACAASASPVVRPYRLTRAVGGRPVTLSLQLSLAVAFPLSFVGRPRLSQAPLSALRSNVAHDQSGVTGDCCHPSLVRHSCAYSPLISLLSM